MKESPVPEVFQNVIGLGPAKQVYRVGCAATAGRAGSAAAIVFILLLMVAFGVLAPFLSEDPISQIPGSLFMIGGALLALYFLWKPFQRAGRTLRAVAVLYEGGFAVSYGGEPPRSFAWKDIRQVTVQIVRHSIYGLIPTGRDYKLTITDDNPGTVELDSPLGGIEQIYNAITENAMPRISAEALAQFQEGKTVAFGPIRADRAQGLLWKDRTLAWDAVKNVKYNDRILYIYPKSGGIFGILMFEDGSIPNIDALLGILREMGVMKKP